MSTREEILGAAQRQLNLDPTSSMADVAAAAGVGRATLHRHFSGREALLTEIGQRSLDRWEQRLDAARVAEVCSSEDAARMRETLVTLLGQYLEDSDDFGFALTDQFVLAEPTLTARGEALAEREIALFAAAQSAGVLRDDVSPRWLSQACYGLLVAARDALRAGDVARRDLDAVVASFFLHGAAAPGKPL